MRAAQLMPALPVVLVAHGSADPRAARSVRALAGAVAAARPGSAVTTAYLDHAGPRPQQVLAGLVAAGQPAAVVVPLLLTAAYHRRVDLPAAVARVHEFWPQLPVRITDVLGPVAGQVPAQLLAGLSRRLAEVAGAGEYDALVLAAAGTRDRAALATVEAVAAGLGRRLGVPCQVGYASAADPDPAAAVTLLRAAGARRVALAAYFMAPGKLYEATVAAALGAGARVAAPPLSAAPELVELVLARVDAAARELLPQPV